MSFPDLPSAETKRSSAAHGLGARGYVLLQPRIARNFEKSQIKSSRCRTSYPVLAAGVGNESTDTLLVPGERRHRHSLTELPMKISCSMPRLGLLVQALAVLVASAFAAPVTAAISDADMQRLLKDPQIPFRYECTAPLTKKYRIEDHATAAYLKPRIELWQECVGEYSARLEAFVMLEITDFPELVANMSPEQRQRYQEALDKAVRAEVAVLKPRVEATRKILSDAVEDYNRRSSSMGFTDREFQTIVARFDSYEYDCELPDPTDGEIGGARRQTFVYESGRFDKCSETWASHIKHFRNNGAGRSAIVRDAEYDRMTPEQQERIDYLVSRLQMFLPAQIELRYQHEIQQRETWKRLDRVGG